MGIYAFFDWLLPVCAGLAEVHELPDGRIFGCRFYGDAVFNPLDGGGTFKAEVAVLFLGGDPHSILP